MFKPDVAGGLPERLWIPEQRLTCRHRGNEGRTRLSQPRSREPAPPLLDESAKELTFAVSDAGHWPHPRRIRRSEQVSAPSAGALLAPHAECAPGRNTPCPSSEIRRLDCPRGARRLCRMRRRWNDSATDPTSPRRVGDRPPSPSTSWRRAAVSRSRPIRQRRPWAARYRSATAMGSSIASWPTTARSTPAISRPGSPARRCGRRRRAPTITARSTRRWLARSVPPRASRRQCAQGSTAAEA